MTVSFLAIATHVTPGYTRFMDSCQRLGLTPMVVEMGSEWLGFAWKFKRVMAALKTVNTDVVLHSDAFDAVCLEGLPSITEKFTALNHPWVFSFEAWPQPEPYLHLNCGMWMANRDYALSTITDKWLEEFFPDHFHDQYQVQAIYSWHPDWFKLDTESRIFYTQNPYAPNLVVQNNRLVNPTTGMTPSFVHAPNHGDLSNVEEWLATVS